MELASLGWNPVFSGHFAPYREEGLIPVRIVRENRTNYVALGEGGRFICDVSGKFRFKSQDGLCRPTTGDWVAVSIRPGERKAIIHALIPGKSSFIRKVAGRVTEAQVVAANVDTVFIVCGLDLNFRLRRIERYLSLAEESGALPVILLNKADLCPDVEMKTKEAQSIASGIDVHVISACQRSGLGALKKYLKTGETVAFLGSSGVGKSTIINALLGAEYLKVNKVSETGSRGRHTTTFRELILVPDGGMVIDTPGMRELQVWGEEESLDRVFSDIEELSGECRFPDCRHQGEPGCAVREAIKSGLLDPERLESFQKLKREFTYLESRQVMKPSRIEKTHWKAISRSRKSTKRLKRGGW